jgi:hypothetical protein
MHLETRDFRFRRFLFPAQAGLRSGALFLLVLGALAAPTCAHELGKMQVYADFLKDGTYRIEISVDDEHLAPSDAGGPAKATRFGEIAGFGPEAQARFGRFLTLLADGAEIRFDGKLVEPRLSIVPPEPGSNPLPGQIRLLLTGAIPGGATKFVWSQRAKVGSYPLVLQNEGDESALWGWLEGGAASPPFELSQAVVPPTRLEVVKRYLVLGFTHILPKGTDHILFILGIFLLSRRLKPLLLQVTAFTLAHTLTLGLCLYGIVSLSPRIVEPLIAVSIVFVAVENIVTPELRPWRIVLVFAFGLLHGLGFAGVLSELGLPRGEFVTGLVSFNVGVEAGQLAVIAVAFALLALPFRHRPWYRSRIVVPASAVIAAVGLFWAVQRVVG